MVADMVLKDLKPESVTSLYQWGSSAFSWGDSYLLGVIVNSSYTYT